MLVVPEVRTCRKCGEPKSPEDFTLRDGRWREWTCKPCKYASAEAWRIARRGHARDHRVLFLNHVEVDPVSGCWLWTGQITKQGYGRSAEFGLGTRQAHRVAWKMFVGPIDDDMDLDHVYANGCRNHHCVNWVDHLEPVTHQENMRRAAAVKPPIERCRRAGHLYDDENTYINPASGKRICRACAKSTPESRAADAERARRRRQRDRLAGAA